MSVREVTINVIMRTPIGQLYRRIPSFRELFWDVQVNDLIKRWRTGPETNVDYPVYRAYLEKNKPKRLLDIGCGSGRLFPLYTELMVPEVVGIDISSVAISKVKTYPTCSVRVMEIEKMNFPKNYFDAAISNAVLRHIPPGVRIAKAISNITEQCYSILLREVVRGRENSYDFRHDYEALFRGKMQLIEHYQEGAGDVFVFTH